MVQAVQSHGKAATRTVERALGLLSEVCDTEAISLTECARRAGIPTSTALRLLRTLEQSGFVIRREDGAFTAGARLLQIGAAALGHSSLARLSEALLRRISDDTGESTYLSVRAAGDTAVYIAMAEGTHSVRHTSWIGRSVPMAGLAVGKALSGTVPERGYAAERDGHESGVTAVSAPVIRPGGAVVAALSLLGPTYRIGDDEVARYGRILVAATHELSTLLGAHLPDTTTSTPLQEAGR